MSIADILSSLPPKPVKRLFFYAGFKIKANGVQDYFQGFYSTDNFEPEAGFELILADIAGHFGSDPTKTHISTFTPL